MEMTALYILSILFIVQSVVHRIQIEKLKSINDKTMDALKENFSKHEELYKFSLACILKVSVESEDYETAKKCKDILDQYKK